MRLAELLQEGYKEVTKKFIKQGHSKPFVDANISKFRELVNKNQISDVKQRDIDFWGKQDFKEFQKFVNSQSSIPSKRKLKQLQGSSLTLVDNEEIFIVVPFDAEASCFYGRNTDWCISKPNKEHFFDYVYQGHQIPIIIFDKVNGEKWAMMYCRSHHVASSKYLSIFDSLDNPTPSEEFNEESSMSTTQIIDLITDNLSDIKEGIQQCKQNDPHVLINRVFEAPSKQRNEHLEHILEKTRNVSLAADYLRYFDGSGIKVEVNLSKQTIIDGILSKQVDQFQVPKCWLEDDDIMIKVITEMPLFYPAISKKLKDNKQLAKQILQRDPQLLTHMSANIKQDENLMIDVITHDPCVIQFLPKLRNDKRFIKKVADAGAGRIVSYISDELLDNESIIKSAVKSYPGTLIFISNKLKDNDEIVKTAIQQDGKMILHASNRLKQNKKMVLLAIDNCAEAFLYLQANNPLRLDPEVRKAAGLNEI